MDIKNISKKSPFYVEYTGKTKDKNTKQNTKTYAYHVKKDFVKPLKEFFDARFGVKATDNEVMEQIVYNYYFRYAHEQTYYEKTIVALILNDELASENPTIIPMFVLNRFPKDIKNDVIIDEEMIANYDLMQYIAWSEPFNDVDSHMQSDIVKQFFSDGFDIEQYGVFNDLKNVNEDTMKDFFVIEIPLNNYLDAKLNGVYCFEDTHNENRAVENLHVGLAIIKDNIKHVDATPIPIIYVWSLTENFEVDVQLINRVSLANLEKLCQRYNVLMFSVLKFFEIENLTVDYKLKENRQEQKRLESQLKKLQEQEQHLMDIEKANLNNKD